MSVPCIKFSVEGSKKPFISKGSVFNQHFTNGEFRYYGACPKSGEIITVTGFTNPDFKTTVKVTGGGAQKTPRVKKEIKSSPSSHVKEINNFLLTSVLPSGELMPLRSEGASVFSRREYSGYVPPVGSLDIKRREQIHGV